MKSPLKPSPGPGDYNPMAISLKRKAGQYKVGTDKRIMLKALNDNPGPGQHKHDSLLSGPKYVFGSEKRS